MHCEYYNYLPRYLGEITSLPHQEDLQETITDFVITADNTAGSQRLSDGTEIRAAVRSKGQIVVLTDTSAHSMQFIGPPYTFGFQQLGRQCGVVGQHAAVDVDGVVYWMNSAGGFLAFDGAVKTLPCTVEDYIFNDIRLVPEIYTGVNADFNEVSWYYPTADSNEINRVVNYNYLENDVYNANKTIYIFQVQ